MAGLKFPSHALEDVRRPFGDFTPIQKSPTCLQRDFQEFGVKNQL
jgi:hypothetical protein